MGWDEIDSLNKKGVKMHLNVLHYELSHPQTLRVGFYPSLMFLFKRQSFCIKVSSFYESIWVNRFTEMSFLNIKKSLYRRLKQNRKMFSRNDALVEI